LESVRYWHNGVDEEKQFIQGPVNVNVIPASTAVSTTVFTTVSTIDYGLLSVGVGIAIAGLAISLAIVRRRRS
jgi:hypothetical protein